MNTRCAKPVKHYLKLNIKFGSLCAMLGCIYTIYC